MHSYVQVRVLVEDSGSEVDALIATLKTPSGFKKQVRAGEWTVRGFKSAPGAKVVSLTSDIVQVHVNVARGDENVEVMGHTLFSQPGGWALLRGRGAGESFYSIGGDDLNFLVKRQISLATRAYKDAEDDAADDAAEALTPRERLRMHLFGEAAPFIDFTMSGDTEKMAKLFVSDDTAMKGGVVFLRNKKGWKLDPKVFAASVRKRLAGYYWGEAEHHAENNADEDDPKTRASNSKKQDAAETRAQWIETKLEVNMEPVTSPTSGTNGWRVRINPPYSKWPGEKSESRLSYLRVRTERLGDGSQFKRLAGKLKRKGVRDPKALAAVIGRKKLGKSRFQQLAAQGRARKK